MMAMALNSVARVALLYFCWKLFRQLQKWANPKHSLLRKGHERKLPTTNPLFAHYMANAQGLWLHTSKWLPRADVPIKGIVFIVHGLGEHIGRYAYVASQLNASGFAVFGMDHQGHGQSEGDRLYAENFQDLPADYHQFIQETLQSSEVLCPAPGKPALKMELKNLPRFIMGHSMGGAITLATLALSRSALSWNGVVLSAPALKPDPEAASPVIRKIATILSQFLPKMPVNSVDHTTVSRNPLVCANYLRDPLVPKTGVTAKFAVELLNTMEELLAKASLVTEPIFIIQGTSDKLVVPQGAVDFYKNCGSTDSELKMYPNLYHEILNSDEKDTIVKDVLHWIEKRV